MACECFEADGGCFRARDGEAVLATTQDVLDSQFGCMANQREPLLAGSPSVDQAGRARLLDLTVRNTNYHIDSEARRTWMLPHIPDHPVSWLDNCPTSSCPSVFGYSYSLDSFIFINTSSCHILQPSRLPTPFLLFSLSLTE